MMFWSCCSPEFDAVGGRTTQKLRLGIAENAAKFDIVVLIVGLYCYPYLRDRSDEHIIHNFHQFKSAIQSLHPGVIFKICGFPPRKDHRSQKNAVTGLLEDPVKRINGKLRKHFLLKYLSPAIFKMSDFRDDEKSHLNEQGIRQE